MYIISKHKDYYDGVVGSVGMDKTLVYERTTEEITDNNKMLKEFQASRNRGWMGTNRDNPFLNIGFAHVERDNPKKYDDEDFFIVGFCGKLYLGWKLYYKVMGWDLETGEKKEFTKTDIVYGYDKVKKFLKDSYWRGNLENDIKYLMDYDPINMFRELKTPVFIYDSERRKPRADDALIINPILKEWEFYKVIDAFTAFQEISMFIGGVLGIGEKEIVEVEDKYKIGQHGFDKWSFRREPSKKK